MNALAYLQKAFLLSKEANSKDIRPNPFVGAIIVDEMGVIIGEGYHKKIGEAHGSLNYLSLCYSIDHFAFFFKYKCNNSIQET